MSEIAIKYKIAAASVNDIQLHLRKCNENFEPALDTTVDISEYSKKIAEQSVTFEAWSADSVVGLVAAYFNDKQGEKGFITNVSTLREYLGNGIASKLLGNCIEYAAQNNYIEIGLEVNARNQKAIRLYEKFNFAAVEGKFENIVMKCSIEKYL